MEEKARVLVFGDSHTVYFGDARQVFGYNDSYMKLNIDCNVKHGAAIAGFGKRQSTTNVKNKLLEVLKTNSHDYLLLNFGQVDVELGLFYRKFIKNENISFNMHCQNIIRIYIEFIQSLPFEKNDILVKGINLPVLCYSKSKWLDYINRIITENIVDPSEVNLISKKMEDFYLCDHSRTNMALLFNETLKSELSKINVEYGDINEELLDESTGLISTNFIPCRMDHHLIDSVGVRNYHWNLLNSFVVKRATTKVLF